MEVSNSRLVDIVYICSLTQKMDHTHYCCVDTLLDDVSQKCKQWHAMKSALPSSIFRYIQVLILQRFQADYDNLMRLL